MQQNLLKKTAIYSVIFFVAAMSFIVYFSMEKVVTITDVAQDEVAEGESLQGDGMQDGDGTNLTFLLGEADTSYLRIPLPADCKASDVIIENHYMDKELWILVPAEEEFYVENPISGNRRMVTQGSFELVPEGCKLKFSLTGIYECRTILENENLYISFQTPSEVHDKIVVIDPACGGEDSGYTGNGVVEKNINLQIAKKLKEKLDESDIKAYYTRMDDVTLDEESRAMLANETSADMFIRIQVNGSEDTSIYGVETAYNGEYFIPGFGSVELADYLEREVVTSVKGKALGLVEASANEEAVCQAMVPAAAVKVGYVTNGQESQLLEREEYAEKIATGIYNAIIAIYEEENN